MFGSTMMSNVLNRNNPAMGKTTKARWSWKHFCHYVTMQNYRKVPWEQQKKNLLWNAQRLIMSLTIRPRTCGSMAKRVVWLAKQLPNKWTLIFMDNLFNSQKLFTALYKAQALVHGVARPRPNGCDISPSIIQLEEKNIKIAESLWGTTRAARLHNLEECPDLFAISVLIQSRRASYQWWRTALNGL